MNIDFESIQDKQRIIIIGNEGTLEIAKLIAHVLNTVNKQYDYIFADGSSKISEAPIVLIQGNDHKEEGKKSAEFLKYRHHIALIHHIEEAFPEEYSSFDEYIEQYESLADKTPKGGTLLYNKEDNLAMVISEKDREEVQLIEYESIVSKEVSNGFKINGSIVKTKNSNFPSHAGAAYGLLRRVSLTDEQILKGIATYKD